MKNTLVAGAAAVNISPNRSMHLFGYPHVERYSTGVHDPLLSSALYLRNGDTKTLFIANDIIFVSKALVARARGHIHQATGIPAGNILISVTHTHSGPGTIPYASNEADPTVPVPDEAYLQQLEDGIVEAGVQAYAAQQSATLGFATADASCVGTNRRDPADVAHPEMPIVLVRNAETNDALALMCICSMHPTVLHEDSTLISGDFPGLARNYIQQEVLSKDCVVLHHSGASGNQSPRHVVESTTFAEAKRLGDNLGKAVQEAIQNIEYRTELNIHCSQNEVDLPLRSFVSETEATAALQVAQDHFAHLQQIDAPRAALRTAECDVFGAEETLTLARVASTGRLEAYAQTCMPAEVQRITLGPWDFLAMPGELFVEFALDIEYAFPNAHVITLANGELQGYLVTEESVQEGGYEASNALFASPEGGNRLVEAAKALLND